MVEGPVDPLEAARRHPDRFAILGSFKLDDPASAALIDGWTDRPGMLGLRFTFMPPAEDAWLTDGTLDWLWPAAEKAGLPAVTSPMTSVSCSSASSRSINVGGTAGSPPAKLA